MTSEWAYVTLILLIYASFILDFVVWPIPSEASTAAILHDGQSAQNTTAVLTRWYQKPLLITAHAMVLITWVFPLAYSVWVSLVSLNLMSGALPASDTDSTRFNSLQFMAVIGIMLALAGRCVTIATSLTLRNHRTSTGKSGIISHGVFARTRHPVVVGLHLTLSGLLITVGLILMALPLLIVFIYFDYKTRLEELTLLERDDIDYQSYRQKVSKYGW